jgi:Glycosyltransferases involved in cell wall biogenesis
MRPSVLINNYNYARFLPETLASVAAQEHPPHEIIVVDDGSTDDSLAVLESLRATYPKLRIHTQPNGGQLSAMRAGVSLATGDWCAFLDADDLWRPNHLAEAARIVSAHPEVGAYCGEHKETSGPSIGHTFWPEGPLGPCAGMVAASASRPGSLTSAMLLRRDFALRAFSLGPEFDQDWITRADDCIVYGAALAGAVFYHNRAITLDYRIHDANSYAIQSLSPYQTYVYELRRWRLIKGYAARFGIAENLLFDLILRELEDFPANRSNRLVFKHFVRALRRAPAPWSRRWRVRRRLRALAPAES